MVGGQNTKTVIAQAGDGDHVRIKAGDNDNEILAVAGEKGSHLIVKAQGGSDTVVIQGKDGPDEIVAQPGKGEKDVMYIDGGEGKNEYHVSGGRDGHSTVYLNDGSGAGYINVSNGFNAIDEVHVNAGGGNDNIWVNLWDTSDTGDKFEINGGEGNNKLTISRPAGNFAIKDTEGNIIYQRGEGGAEITVKDIYEIRICYTGCGVTIKPDDPTDGKAFNIKDESTQPLTGNNAHCYEYVNSGLNKYKDIEKISTSTKGYVYAQDGRQDSMPGWSDCDSRWTEWRKEQRAIMAQEEEDALLELQTPQQKQQA
jgi:hypothetical protein